MREAQARQGPWLLVGAIVTGIGILGLGLLPALFVRHPFDAMGYLWAAILLGIVGYRMCVAITLPQPLKIQPAVKTAILGIILFDATLVAFTRGLPLSVPVLLLLVPAIWLGKWLYST